MSTYITIDATPDVMLPTGSFTSRKAAVEAAGDNENVAVIANADELFKAFKLKEIVTLHNSVVTAEEASAGLGNKREASQAAFAAISKYDFSTPPAHQEPAEKKRGRKATGKNLESLILSANATGGSTLTESSNRTQIYKALVEFQGQKKSVSYTDFQASLSEELRSKLASAIRYLVMRLWVTATVENESGEQVEWLAPRKELNEKFNRRQAEAEEKRKLSEAKKLEAKKEREAAKEAAKDAKAEKAKKDGANKKREKPTKE